MAPKVKRRLRYMSALIVALFFLLIFFVPRITDLSQGGSSKPSPETVAYADHLATWVNAERARFHRPPLTVSPCLVGYASRWAQHLAVTGQFTHQSLPPIMASCRATRSAENIVRGNVTAYRLFSAWWNSPPHRANLLDPRLRRMGLAVVYGRGGWSAVQDFSN